MLRHNIVLIQFAKDPKFHQKTKHIKRHCHFVRDNIKTNDITIKYISTNKKIDYPLTKSIPGDVFSAHAMNLGLHRVWFLIYLVM